MTNPENSPGTPLPADANDAEYQRAVAEYEQQVAEYERQLAEYNAAIAQQEAEAAVAPAAAPATALQTPPPMGYTQPFSATPPPAAPKKKRSIGAIITIVLLSLALVAALIVLYLYITRLDAADKKIQQQDQKIDEQEELIELKETFGAAINSLLDDAREFEGNPIGELVPVWEYEIAATQAWSHRWDADRLRDDIADIDELKADLSDIRAAAASLAGSNATGSTYEAIIDSLGGGYVESLLYSSDTFCGASLACVSGSDPYTVHFDSVDYNKEYMTDFLQTGIAYHEFAHVLQFTNEEATDEAVKHFADHETMADCFALTYLDGWKLDHTIYVSAYSYWNVSVGYGYTCTESERQVIRDWYSQLGYQAKPISQ